MPTILKHFLDNLEFDKARKSVVNANVYLYVFRTGKNHDAEKQIKKMANR